MKAGSALAIAAGLVVGGVTAGLLDPAIAAAAPFADGTYRFNFAGGQPTSFDSPDPRAPVSWMLAIRSACPPAGCVATATLLDSANPQVPFTPLMTFVYRQSGGRWIASYSQGFACKGNKTAGTVTQSFAASGDGTLAGDVTESALPCAPISRPFTATREGDLPPGVAVADPQHV